MLVEIGKIDPNRKSSTDDTALHIAIKYKRLEVAYFLILADCDLNLKNTAGETSLHLAIMEDDVKLVRSLLLFGADPELKDNKGVSVTIKAIQNQGPNRDEILKSLQEVGAINLEDYNKSGSTSPQAELSEEHSASPSRKSTGESIYPTLPSAPNLKELGVSMSVDEMSISNTSICTVGISPKPKKLRVLSLDGGGVRGIVLTKILQAIEHEAKRPAHTLFDWIIGTSTGALFAAALATKKSPAYCQRLYFRLKDEVFKGSRPYDNKVIEDFLKKEFGENTKMTSITDHKLILTTALADRHPTELFLFRSYDPISAEIQDQVKTTVGNQRFDPLPKPEFTNIWEACRSSSAAPSYFRPHGRFVDGALISNNPTMDCLTEIERYNRALKQKFSTDRCKSVEKAAEEDLDESPRTSKVYEDLKIGLVCSLGTGRLPTTSIDNVDIQIPTGLFSAIDAYNASKNVANMLLDAATETDRYIVSRTEAWCRMIDAKYFRLNSQLKDATPLDTIDDEILMQILWETEIYVHKNRKEIKKLAKLLVQMG